MQEKEKVVIYQKEYKNITYVLLDEVSIFCQDNIIKVNAIWDTGSTNSCISISLANQLRLQPVRNGELKSSGGSMDTSFYKITFSLIPELTFKNEVMSFNNCNQNIDFLIGMDIISKGEFNLATNNGYTLLTFKYPVTTEIEFVRVFSSTQ